MDTQQLEHIELDNHESRLRVLELALVKDPVKDALKEALKEWLDEKFTEVGKWTARGVFVAAFGALIYFILITNGWKSPG